jgi:SagB-type dehydrogenase family enzyme
MTPHGTINRRKSYPIKLIAFILIILFILPVTVYCDRKESANSDLGTLTSSKLPAPKTDSEYSIEKALASRRSVRRYSNEAVSLADASQILWAAQGITLPERGYRTAPSAGARFPLEIYLITGNIDGLEPAFYHYSPEEHTINKLRSGDLREGLTKKSTRQAFVKTGAFIVIIAADYSRITDRYGDERGRKYVHMEVGHASQNIHLQAESLDLGTVVIGAFDPTAISSFLDLPDNIEPLYLMPLGKK